MSLFSIFNAEAKFDNLLQIHINGKVDQERSEALPRLIGDVWVLNRLKLTLKSAHKAFQDYLFSFDAQMEIFTSNLYKGKTIIAPDVNIESLDASTVSKLRDFWNNILSADTLVSKSSEMEDWLSGAGDGKVYRVLETIIKSDYQDRHIVSDLAELKATGQKFLNDVNEVRAKFKILDDDVRQGQLGQLNSNIDNARRPVFRAAMAADQLMERTERMLEVTRRRLERIVPQDDFYSVPGLDI